MLNWYSLYKAETIHYKCLTVLTLHIFFSLSFIYSNPEDFVQAVQSTSGMAIVLLIRSVMGSGDEVASVVSFNDQQAQFIWLSIVTHTFNLFQTFIGGKTLSIRMHEWNNTKKAQFNLLFVLQWTQYTYVNQWSNWMYFMLCYVKVVQD